MLSNLSRIYKHNNDDWYKMVEIINLIKTFSDGYTTDDISYQWDSDDPLQLSNNLDLPRFVIVSDIILWHLTKWIKNRFNIEHYSSSYCNVKTNTGKAKKDRKQNDKRYFFRRIQLLVGGSCVQAAVLLLPHHHLRPWLHARHCVLGLSLSLSIGYKK